MPKQSNRPSIVRQGGIGRNPSDTEDVTRDTYGAAQPQPIAKQHGERLAEAERAAEAAGIPGIAIPEPPVSQPADISARDEEVRRTNISGDGVASRRDVDKLRAKRS